MLSGVEEVDPGCDWQEDICCGNNLELGGLDPARPLQRESLKYCRYFRSSCGS